MVPSPGDPTIQFMMVDRIQVAEILRLQRVFARPLNSTSTTTVADADVNDVRGRASEFVDNSIVSFWAQTSSAPTKELFNGCYFMAVKR